jgi:hypothetical protein
MDVTVHIERLTLDGVALGPGGADRLREALAQSLSGTLHEALANSDAPRLLVGGLGRADRLPQLTVQLPPGTGPAAAVPASARSRPAGAALAAGQAAALGRDTGRALAAGMLAPGGAR